MSTPVVTSRASHHPSGDTRFDVPMLVRLTPELHELIKQGAAIEGRRIAEFMRDAAIIRLGELGLVPVVHEDEPMCDVCGEIADPCECDRLHEEGDER